MHYSEPQWLGNAPESRKAFGSIGSDGPEKASGGTGICILVHLLESRAPLAPFTTLQRSESAALTSEF